MPGRTYFRFNPVSQASLQKSQILEVESVPMSMKIDPAGGVAFELVLQSSQQGTDKHLPSQQPEDAGISSF